MTPLVAVLAVLSVYRLTILVTADEIFEPARGDAIDWLDDHDHPKLATLWGCAWCASMWIAVPVAFSAERWGTESWWQVVALALSASAASGFLARFAAP